MTASNEAPATQSTGHTVIFDLPLELRQLIYRNALTGHETGTGLALLQTSKQIAMDARTYLYERPLTFRSQAMLFDWLGASNPSDLRRVHTMTLGLTDIDMSSTFSPGADRVSIWDLYTEELRKLGSAFEKLGNLETLTILPPRDTHSYLFLDLHRRFVDSLRTRLQMLETLNLPQGQPITAGPKRASSRHHSEKQPTATTALGRVRKSLCHNRSNNPAARKSSRNPSAHSQSCRPRIKSKYNSEPSDIGKHVRLRGQTFNQCFTMAIRPAKSMDLRCVIS